MVKVDKAVVLLQNQDVVVVVVTKKSFKITFVMKIIFERFQFSLKKNTFL